MQKKSRRINGLYSVLSLIYPVFYRNRLVWIAAVGGNVIYVLPVYFHQNSTLVLSGISVHIGTRKNNLQTKVVGAAKTWQTTMVVDYQSFKRGQVTL